jgi:RsiW-degrading membrane proteinase PrsW (M82 family)
MENVTEFLVPIIILACVLVGYAIKHTPFLDKVANDYIPLIVIVLGAILGAVIDGVSVESIVYGAVSGLASTGLHQAFTRTLGIED